MAHETAREGGEAQRTGYDQPARKDDRPAESPMPAVLWPQYAEQKPVLDKALAEIREVARRQISKLKDPSLVRAQVAEARVILRFCLEYAESPADHARGVFESIRRNFRDLRGTGLLKLLTDVYTFRNTYVAHQDKELTDREETRRALGKWVELVVRLEEIAARSAPVK